MTNLFGIGKTSSLSSQKKRKNYYSKQVTSQCRKRLLSVNSPFSFHVWRGKSVVFWVAKKKINLKKKTSNQLYLSFNTLQFSSKTKIFV